MTTEEPTTIAPTGGPIRPRVTRLIANLAVPQRDHQVLKGSDRLIEDLGFDSVRLIELTMTLERAFGLPTQRLEDLADVRKVDDVVEFTVAASDAAAGRQA